jgi:hypothetical protein
MRAGALLEYALRTSLPRSFLGEPVMVDLSSLLGSLLNAVVALAHGTATLPPLVS